MRKRGLDLLKVWKFLITDPLCNIDSGEYTPNLKQSFTPKTLEDLGIDRSSDYNLSAPDRQFTRPGSSNSHNLNANTGNLISTSPGASPAGTPTHSHSRNRSAKKTPMFRKRKAQRWTRTLAESMETSLFSTVTQIRFASVCS